jgi:hypothetical protein
MLLLNESRWQLVNAQLSEEMLHKRTMACSKGSCTAMQFS